MSYTTCLVACACHSTHEYILTGELKFIPITLRHTPQRDYQRKK